MLARILQSSAWEARSDYPCGRKQLTSLNRSVTSSDYVWRGSPKPSVAIIANMSLLAACMMHVARIIGSMHDACCKDCTGTPASQTMVGGRTTFQNSPAWTLLFSFQYTISLIEYNYWHNTVTMTMHGRTTLQASTLTLPLCCKSMWKYQNYVISSSRKAEGGNLEQSCRPKSSGRQLFHYCSSILSPWSGSSAVTVASMADPVPRITILLQSEELWRGA